MDDLRRKEMQIQLVNMLKTFHQFCQDHNLHYYVIEGTMLGAARHSGFIPWDDDIDVGMPRADFERLKKFARINDRYIFETIESTDRNFCFVISKLYDNSTTLIENTRYKLIRGIYIDIFPIDGLGSNEKKAVKHFKIIERKKLLLKLRNSPDKKDRKLIKNVIIGFVRKLPATIADEKKICKDVDILCKSYDFNNSQFAGNLLGAWGKKEIMPIEFFGTPQLYQFEDIYVYGVEKPDEYLKHLYGDWRQLPPTNKRVTHHDYFLDLDTPFSEYILKHKSIVD